MNGIWCGLYMAVLLIVGTAATFATLGQRRTSIPEMLALIFSLGLGVSCSLLIWLSMLGLRPGRGVILTLGVVALAAVIGSIWTGRFPRPLWPTMESNLPMSLLNIPPMLVILGALVISLILGAWFRTFNWDSVVIWGMKARVLHFFPLTPRPWYFDDVRFSYSHLDYPLLAPMMFAGGFGMMQGVNDQASRIVLPLIYVGQILLVYSGARVLVRRLPALLITVITCCPQFVVQQTAMGSADIPLAMFRAGTVAFLLRWWEMRRRDDAILCGLFTFFAAMTKSEGLPLALITAGLFVGPVVKSLRERQTLIGVISFLAILIVGIAIWLIWKIDIPHADENYAGRLSPSFFFGNLSRLGAILATMARRTIQVDDWGVLWLLIPLAAVIGHRAFREPRTCLLWAMLLLHLGLYIFVYIITPWDVKELMFNSLDRLLIHIAPTAALVLAAHFASISTAAEGNCGDTNISSVRSARGFDVVDAGGRT